MENKKQTSKLDILAFGAHPDDVEAGCGGLLVKAAKAGFKTGIVDLSLGELATNGTVGSRQKEAEEARKILKVKIRENLKLPNNFFENSPKVQEKIIRLIRKYRPEMVLLPYWFDRHPDHQDVAKLVRPALFTSGLVKYKTGQAPHRPKYLLFYLLWFEFKPSMVVDITEEWEEKVKALASYKSQLQRNKKNRPTVYNDRKVSRLLEARARNYGFLVGKTFGEPYLSIGPVGTKNPLDFLPNYF